MANRSHSLNHIARCVVVGHRTHFDSCDFATATGRFSVLGVISPAESAMAFGDPMVQLMFGGFLLSAALEKSGAHRRIALMMVNFFGQSNSRSMVFGFMSASAFFKHVDFQRRYHHDAFANCAGCGQSDQ